MKSDHPHPSLIALFVRRPVAVSMFYAAVALLGVVSLLRLPVDLLPDLSYPRLAVCIYCSGTYTVSLDVSRLTPPSWRSSLFAVFPFFSPRRRGASEGRFRGTGRARGQADRSRGRDSWPTWPSCEELATGEKNT